MTQMIFTPTFNINNQEPSLAISSTPFVPMYTPQMENQFFDCYNNDVVECHNDQEANVTKQKKKTRRGRGGLKRALKAEAALNEELNNQQLETQEIANLPQLVQTPKQELQRQVSDISHKAEAKKEAKAEKEVVAKNKFKSQNCRGFYTELNCPFGDKCLFRHEHRSFERIHRHFYMAHLTTLPLKEDLIEESEELPAKQVGRLSIFAKMTSEASQLESESTASSTGEDELEEILLSALSEGVAAEDSFESLETTESDQSGFLFETNQSRREQKGVFSWPEKTNFFA